MGFLRFIAVIAFLCFLALPSPADEIGASDQEVRLKPSLFWIIYLMVLKQIVTPYI